MAVTIKFVHPGSPASKTGIKENEILLSINGNEIVDVLDYRFHQTARNLELVIRDYSGTERKVFISKPEYAEIGLEFETYLMDKQHSCKNKCIFCFIDQLPEGMRESLYFKDDDSRLSFLFGNYITLTNLTEHEINRIIKMHISPINVSVHTTNPELRCKMMNNRFAGDTLSILKRFAESGIKINCQIVSCPGINDGEELKRTIFDLEKLYPAVECIAIVPVGLTKHREGLYPLKPYTKETARETLNIINDLGESFLEKYGTRIVYPADEFFIKAEEKIPDAEYYEDFEQLENGVGLIALMREEFREALESGKYLLSKPRKITTASGVSAAPFMKELYTECEKHFEGLSVNVVPIKNEFFGEMINVSGLVTGRDLINQLKDLDLGEELLIPEVMLRYEGDMFLDDVTLDDARRELNIKITPVRNNGEDLLKAVLGIEK